MSSWLRRLVAQSRGSEHAVRPATSAWRAPASMASGATPSIESETFVATSRAPTSGFDARLSAPRLSQRSTFGDAEPGEPHVARSARMAPSLHDVRANNDAELAPPQRTAARDVRGGEALEPRRDVRRRDDDEHTADRAARDRTQGDGLPRARGDATRATIRPSSPPRVAAPVRAAAAADAPAPVPDVHIHIGRLELTALTAAPTPRRERAPAHQPMSLDEYLRRRNGGTR